MLSGHQLTHDFESNSRIKRSFFFFGSVTIYKLVNVSVTDAPSTKNIDHTILRFYTSPHYYRYLLRSRTSTPRLQWKILQKSFVVEKHSYQAHRYVPAQSYVQVQTPYAVLVRKSR